MATDFSKNSIEAEIAELSQKIAEKRRQLESKSGIVEERDLARTGAQEQLSQTPTGTPPASSSAVASSGQAQTKPQVVTYDPAGGKSYLDYLSEESRDIVTALVGVAFEKGVKEAIRQAEQQAPFILDAFHDVLRDKVFNEIKDRGLLK